MKGTIQILYLNDIVFLFFNLRIPYLGIFKIHCIIIIYWILPQKLVCALLLFSLYFNHIFDVVLEILLYATSCIKIQFQRRIVFRATFWCCSWSKISSRCTSKFLELRLRQNHVLIFFVFLHTRHVCLIHNLSVSYYWININQINSKLFNAIFKF